MSFPNTKSAARFTTVESLLLVTVLAIAALLRCWKLDQPLMWCDEAESAINSLTILSHGYPNDRYLGLPIFENVLTEPWPENPEYEFRDTSYSKRGVAVYHGWLPLYVMAGSLRAFGIEPAEDMTRLQAKYAPNEMSTRTIAARAPSILFGIIFLILIYLTATEMYGKDAGWAALLAATVAVPIVHVARQARYYSLTLALSIGCCLMIWKMATRGWWRDYFIGAILLGLLFHTHVLTFMIVCFAGMVMLPWIVRGGGAISKIFGAGIVSAAMIVPWMVHTGFLDNASDVPKAVATLSLPWDLFIYPIERWPVTIFLVGSAIWIWTVQLLARKLPSTFAIPFLESRGPFYFLAAWGLIGWLAFMLLIPAASLWFPRAYLGIVGPGIVLGAIVFAAVGRVVGKRVSIPVGCALFLAFIYANVRANYSWNRDTAKNQKIAQVIEQMRHWPLRAGTKIYSTPSDQLILTYYTDVPVQSIAPVRKTFLDHYPNDIVVLECFTRFVPIWTELVQSAAWKYGIDLPHDTARVWANRLTALSMRNYLQGRVAQVNISPEQVLPPFASDLLEYQQQMTRRGSQVQDNPVAANPSIFRGYDMPDYSYWWQIFFYRFVGIEQRSGENLNYVNRIRNASATVLPGTYVIYHSPGTNTSQARTEP